MNNCPSTVARVCHDRVCRAVNVRLRRARRAFLCGPDRFTERNFDRRQQWLVERMKELAAIFAIDICAYGVLSSHFHVILHVEPDVFNYMEDG